MNDYEIKQADRKARYEDRAEKARAESGDTYAQARRMQDVIPFGQPIHIGHYSERGDRRYRDRIQKTYEKSFALIDKAEHYESKAAGVGTAGISSDNPEALSKLRTKLAEAQASHEADKKANRVLRTVTDPQARTTALLELGVSQETIAWVTAQSYRQFGSVNSAANIRRIKERIAELERNHARDDLEQQGPGYVYREDTSENRVMFLFEGKPEERVRNILKSHAFKWSPTRGAWVRQLNNTGRNVAQMARAELDALAASPAAAGVRL